MSRNKIARYVRRLHLRLFNWPPRLTRQEKNVESRRNLVDPSEVTLLGRVSTDKPSSVESTPKQKKKRSDGSPRSSKRKHSSKPTSDDPLMTSGVRGFPV